MRFPILASILFACLLTFTPPCSAKSFVDEIKSSFTKLSHEFDRFLDSTFAKLKGESKSTKSELKDDLKEAGKNLENAADQAAKKLKKLR